MSLPVSEKSVNSRSLKLSVSWVSEAERKLTAVALRVSRAVEVAGKASVDESR